MRKSDRGTMQEEKTCFSCDIFSAHHVFAMYGFLGVSCFNAMRSIMSVAIVAMVRNPQDVWDGNSTSEEICPGDINARTNLSQRMNASITNLKIEADVYDWDIRTQSIILASFFYGYTPFHFPGGLVAQRFGGKFVFGISLFLSSIFTLITPFVCDFGASFLIALRTLEGLSQGAVYPAINILVSHWAPYEKKSTIIAFVYCGIPLGNSCGLLLGGVLAGTFGWPSIFYAFGGFGIILTVFWAVFIHESPSVHPRISEKEMKFEEQKRKPAINAPKVPWSSLMCSLCSWSTFAGMVGLGWATSFYMTELPSYFSSVFHFDIIQNGYLSGMSYIVQGLSNIIASYLADKMRQSAVVSNTTVRKIMNSIAAFGSASCSLLMLLTGCAPAASIALIYAAVFLTGFYVAGIRSVIVELSPNYAGVMCGIAHSFASSTGMLVPYITGELTQPQPTSQTWSMVFVVSAAISTACGVVFDAFGSAEVQKWDPASRDIQQRDD